MSKKETEATGCKTCFMHGVLYCRESVGPCDYCKKRADVFMEYGKSGDREKPDETVCLDCLMNGRHIHAAHAAKAKLIGAAEGKARASWFFDGNTTTTTYRAVLAGLDDGDPAILDTLPSADLSGEFAEGRTPKTLAEDCGLADAEGEIVEELCNAYEEAFNTAAEQEIERVCHYHLDD